MEACFVTSNSFTKTVELVASPTTKARILTYPNRIPNQFRYFKARVPSVSCCHVESSWSSVGDDNDKKPIIGADWRRFRARLVAGEESWRRVIDHDDHPPPPPQISIGEKWAHPLHEPEKGCLLIATEKLDGVHIFERTVVLLLSTGPVGPSGIILNRPSLMSIKEARSTVLDVEGTFSERPLFFGGPLEEGVFLVSGGDGVFEEVMKGLWYGRKESVGCAAEMVKRNVVGIEDFSFFDGYCGWDKEQLREEIRAGYWKVAACSPNVIGSTCLQRVGLWDDILGLMAPRKVW